MERIGRTSHNIPSGKPQRALKSSRRSTRIHFVISRSLVVGKDSNIEAPKSKYAGVAQLVEQLIRKNQVCDSKSEYANVAQSVEQLIRNQ